MLKASPFVPTVVDQWFCLRFAWPLANGLLEFCLSKTWIPAITTTPQAWGPSPRVDSLVGRGISHETEQSFFLLSTGGRPVESSKLETEKTT